MVLDSVTPALSFANETMGLSIDLSSGIYSDAARLLPIGDSLTFGVLGDPTTEPENQAGYRDDLFEGLLSEGVFIDYVGVFQTGPGTLLDMDHSGDPGEQLRRIAKPGVTVPANLGQNLEDFAPDIVALMAGTNDFSADEQRFFSIEFPRIVSNIQTVVTEFYSYAGSDDKHLIISTLPPKLNFGTLELTEIVNQGYSILNGEEVAGDAGNGTYQPGIITTVQALQAIHPTLHLYQAPFNISDIGGDLIHYTDAGYAAYATGLQNLIETEIGFANGTINGTAQTLGAGDNVEGGQAGDFIIGSAVANLIDAGDGNDIVRGGVGNDRIFGEGGNDRLEGEAGVDQVTGGLGNDTFVFGTDFAVDHGAGDADAVTDFGNGADRFVFDATFTGEITVTDAGAGVQLTVGDGAGGTLGLIDVTGTAAQSLKGTDLGGGIFDLTTDDTLVTFAADTDFLLG